MSSATAIAVLGPAAFATLHRLAALASGAGGRCVLVGGAVRDMVFTELGRGLHASARGEAVPSDLDVEVHGLAPAALEALLRPLGPLNLVGKAFLVYKLLVDGIPVDVSLPRSDNRSGRGHRGFRVEPDPFMGFARAARRRDLTLNAMAFDPLSSSLEDPFEGRRDIERGLLRAVDPLRFGEDPLRALRVLRFAARFEFEAEEQLQALCRAMPVEELPSERLLDEIRKMLLQARRPSLGLRLGHALGLWPRVLPVREFPVESTSAALDRAAALAASLFPGPDPRGEALLHVALFHGLGPTGAEACMDRLGIYTSGGFPMRRALLHALEFSPGFDPDISDGGLRRLAWSSREVGGLPLLVACATCLSEGFDLARTMERVHALGLEQTAPPPLIRGRELRQAGISPGPEMGRLLEELHALQLEEGIEDPEVLRARLIERLGRSSSQS